MRYFEENALLSEEPSGLHDMVLDCATTVASNLFDLGLGDDSPSCRMRLARSACLLVGICEGVLSLVPERDADRALGQVSERLAESAGDRFERAAKAALLAFFQGGE